MLHRMGNKGFTLIELLIVIAIMAILAAAAYFYMGNRANKDHLRADSNDLAGYMKLARTGAIRDTRSWAIQFNQIQKNFVIYSASGETAPTLDDWTDSDETIYRTITLNKVVNFGSNYGFRPGATVLPSDGISFSANRLVFNSNGTSESGTVYLTIPTKETFAISSLSTTGRVKIWKNYGSGWSN